MCSWITRIRETIGSLDSALASGAKCRQPQHQLATLFPDCEMRLIRLKEPLVARQTDYEDVFSRDGKGGGNDVPEEVRCRNGVLRKWDSNTTNPGRRGHQLAN